MKLIALLLSLLLSFNVMANSIAELERTIDDHQYTMTVEWNQKDQKFFDTKSDEFMSKIAKLIREKGITKEDILKLSAKKVNNEKTFNALKLKLSLIEGNGSSEQLANTLKETSREFYSKGASWNGEAVMTGALIAVFVIAIGFAIWFSITHECVAYEDRYSCSTSSYCVQESWDEYGSYCSWWDEEETCGWESVCTKYEKKK